MKKNGIIIKITIILLAAAICLVRAVFPESRMIRYAAPVGSELILLLLHLAMPVLAGLPGDNPKVKTMRRINLLIAAVAAVLLISRSFLPEREFGDRDHFLLLFSVAVTLLVGNAAPKLPVNPVMGVRLPWTKRDPDNWRATHKVLGYCAFPIALLMLTGGLLIDPVVFSVGGLLAFALIPAVYSWIYHYKKKSS